MTRAKVALGVGGLFAVVGVVFVVVAAVLGLEHRDFLSDAERTDGTVVDVVEHVTRDEDGTSRTYRPVVEYEVDGTTHRFQSSTGTNPPAHEVGDRVEVAYAPDDPRDARLTDGSFSLLPLIFAGVGMVLALVGSAIGVVGLRGFRRQRRLLRDGMVAPGRVTVLGRDTSVKVNGRPLVRVVATWTAPDGTERTAQTSVRRTRCVVGDAVRVRYDPAVPEDAVIEDA